MSVSGHQHYQQHLYLGKEDGWEGDKPHHHVINVTASELVARDQSMETFLTRIHETECQMAIRL